MLEQRAVCHSLPQETKVEEKLESTDLGESRGSVILDGIFRPD